MTRFSWFTTVAVATFALFVALSAGSPRSNISPTFDGAENASGGGLSSGGDSAVGLEHLPDKALAMVTSALHSLSVQTAGGGGLDWASLLLGIAIGFGLATAAHVPWMEFPRRVFRWLAANERNFYRIGMAAILLGVVLFY